MYNKEEFLTELGELLVKYNVSIEYYPRWDDGLHLVFGDDEEQVVVPVGCDGDELLRMVGKI